MQRILNNILRLELWVTKKTPQQLLKDIEFLKSRGITVPLPAEAHVRQVEMKSKGVKEYYRCSYCGYDYESYVELQGMNCPKKHAMKKIWSF
jgi:DNA-directed RNA polymerase subunit RPC12/RpoP